MACILQAMSKTFKRCSALLAIAVLALMQGCSAIKLAYNNAPEFSYWWLDGYVDFNESQTLKVRAELARLQQWHRTDELPKIAGLIQKGQRLAETDMAAGAVCALFAETRARFDAATAQAEPTAVALAMSLTPEQIANIDHKLTKVHAEYRNEWLKLTPAERFEKRFKSNVERSEQFYGKLEERQRTVLRAGLETSSFDVQASYNERLRRQQDFMQTLRQVTGKTSQAEVLVALRGYLDRSINSPNPAYRAYSQKLTNESCALFAQIHNTTSPEQRTRAVRRLADYARDAMELNALR
jgi:Family of unknown function (DUF6279)